MADKSLLTIAALAGLAYDEMYLVALRLLNREMFCRNGLKWHEWKATGWNLQTA